MTVDSPLGPLTLVAGTSGLQALLWPNSPSLPSQLCNPGHPLLLRAKDELNRYFSGSLKTFTVPLERHGTPFQTTVWDALCTIPYGRTVSYAELACQIGRPTAVRAVARAIGSNPLGIIVPCHRVIGSNGSLTGFAGGLKAKAALLALEAA